MKIFIIGGGFVGQLIHTLIPKARVFDWRAEAPKTPARQLGPQYLWEPLPNMQCRKFEVFTTIDGEQATDDRILSYKKKVGKSLDGSDWKSQFRYHMHGYDPKLPPDRVEYGRRVIEIKNRRLEMADGNSVPYDVVISTIPLNHMMAMARIPYNPLTLQYRPIYVKVWEHCIDPDHPMLVDYVSDPDSDIYRSTIREGKRYDEALRSFAGNNCVRVVPGKIYENDDTPNILRRLNQAGIHCFGRFARWAPDELAHETFKMADAFIKEVGL